MKQLPISLARNWIVRETPSVSQIIQKINQTINVEVVVDVMEWDNLWGKLNTIATEKSDVVISEIGSTWLSSLVENQVLYSFAEDDIDQIGGFGNFTGWQVGANSHWREVYAIPWWSDSQVLFYWRDMIEDAGVDPTIEFASVNSFENALSKISKKSLRYPWAVSTLRGPASLHQLSSWIWGSDADIIDEDGVNLRILDIKAIQAITQYFNLYRYIPEYSRTSVLQMTEYFSKREAALMMGATRTYYQLQRMMPDHMMERVGVALPPGVPFVGTQHLVMWNHTIQEQQVHALQFLKAFLSPEIHHSMSKLTGLMPTNTELLNHPDFQQNEFLWTINTAIQIGKSYPALPKWTIVEHHLLNAIEAIWNDIIVDQATDIENVVFKHLIRFGQHVRPVLS